MATLLAAASLAFATWCIAAESTEPVLPERWILPVPYTGLAALEDGPAGGGGGGGGGGTVVYHVTKEFGPATLGGLGAVVTMIAQAQTARGVDVRVVLPYYSYLAQYQPRRVRTVTIPYRPRGSGAGGRDEVERVAAEVFLMQYAGVSVYLLNAGQAGPLSSAFVASDRLNIYTESRTLSWELRDLLFCALAAQLLVDLDADPREPQAVAHLHGATNAVVAPMFRDLVRALGQRARTAFVYTLHDYDEETTYHVQIEHLRRLAAFPFAVEPTVHTVVGPHVYLSHFGISQADVVTCVSEVLAADMVEGRQQITNSVLVIDALQAKARARHFVGIPNGVDLVSHSPFNSTVLLRAGLHYDVHSSIAARKAAAKRALCEADILDRDACERPLILFVGRFQLNKGIDLCEVAAEILMQVDVSFVVLGMYTTKDADVYLRLIRQHGGVIIDDPAIQEEYGPVLRAAADIVFVPSKTEAFGLVAAEGLAYGALVVTTGVGGLRDFLRERKRTSTGLTHNAYFFHRSSRRELEAALHDALEFLAGLSAEEHEAYVRALIEEAHTLRWDRTGGPLDRYDQVYRLAKSLVV